jgi:hypothetical protein
MQTKPYLALLGLIVLTAIPASAQTGAGSPLSDTQWKGVYGSGTQANTPATLQIHSQNGSLMGTLTYDRYEETFAITATGTRALRLKGVSYRILRGGGTFDLDNFSGQLSPDGNRLNATGGDAKSVVANEWLNLQKVNSTPGAAPQAAPPGLTRSLIGSRWDGAIAESQKGGTPVQLRIVQQNGGLNAVLVWDGFEEILGITLTAPSGIQMRGTSYRDLQNQRRRFTLDNARGEISSDGHNMQGLIDGRHFEFRRVN